MLFKTRQVRSSSKFQSRMRSSSRQRQEYAATVMSQAVIQGVLSVALFIASIRSYQAVDVHGEGVPLVLKLVMPVAFVIGGLWCLRLCVKNLRSSRALWTMSRRSNPPRS